MGYFFKVETFPDSRAESRTTRYMVHHCFVGLHFFFLSSLAISPLTLLFALRCTLLVSFFFFITPHSPSLCFLRHFISHSNVVLTFDPHSYVILIFYCPRGFYGILMAFFRSILLISLSIPTAFIIPNPLVPPHQLYQCFSFLSRPSIFSFQGSFMNSQPPFLYVFIITQYRLLSFSPPTLLPSFISPLSLRVQRFYISY